MGNKISSISFFTFLVFASSCTDENSNRSKKINVPIHKPTPELKFSVDAKIPHSVNAFTEGLLMYENQIFESTGSPENLPQTKSYYGVVNQETGDVEIHNQLDPKYFGEGITILNNKVYQLTYQSRKGFIYDLESKKQLKSFTLPTREGWGLTTDGENLIMSDGTSSLHFLNPETLEKIGTLNVLDNGRPVQYLNELEFVNGFIYANVYTTDWVVKIDLNTGKVVAKIDLTDLKLEEDRKSSDALETNGIAFNPETKKFYFTGKMWSSIYILSVFE